MKKRLLSMILAFSMMLTILPVNAITALAANNSCGANLTYTLTPNTDDPGTYTLTISGEGAMYDYSSSTVPWDAQKSKITSVVIGNGVTSIGNNAFEDCSALKMLDIPQTVNRIGNTAFQGCSNLETINIPSGVKLIEKDTFHGCEKLNDVTIPAGVTLIGNSAFKACKTFRNIEIPKGVTKIDYFAFEDCTQLETVVIPSTATNIRNFAFRNCPKLKSFVFPSGTTQIQPGVLSGCKNLESVTIPEGVIKIFGSAFYGCSQKLNSVKLPSTLQTICKLAFYGCDQLSEITIPKSVKFIEESAFESSTELKSVMLAKGSVPTIAENAFSKSLGTKTKIYYPDYKAEWFAQNAAGKITDLKTDGVTISAGGKSMDVDICYLCDVTFNANGGTLASGAPAKTQVYRTEMVTNTKANNLKTVDDPSKPEYTFIGWYTSPTPQEGEAAFSLADTPVDPQTEDGNLTLYAVYTTVTISGPTDNTVKAGEGSNVFTVAADKGTGAAKAEFDFAGGKVQYRTGDTGEWFDLTSNELNIDDLTGKQFRVVPDADAATAQKTLTVKLMDASGNEIAGATASTTFAVTARKPAEVTITGLDNTTVKAGEAKDFTVNVTPNDDANTGAKATITVSGANANAVEKIQYKDGETWKDVPDEGLSIDKINNTEFKLITKADANDGAVTITVTAKKANGTEIDKKVAAVTVKKHENAAVTITGLDGTTVKAGEAKEFTVNVTPNDDTIDKVTFVTTSGEVQWSSDNGNTWTTVSGDVDYSELTGKKFRVVPAADATDGTVTVTITAKKAGGTEIAKTATFTVTAREHATVEINDLNGETIKQNKPHTFTVTVTAHDDSGNATLTFDNVAGLTHNGTAVTDAGVTVALTNQPAPLTFTLTPDAEGAGKTLTATLNNGATDTATYNVSAYEHAKVTIEGLGTDLKQGESKDFTVKVDPKDDSGNAIIDFGDKNSEIQYKDGEDWKPMPSGGLEIDLSETHDFRITPKNDGSQTLTATVKQNDNELDRVEQTYTVAKKDEPTTPGGGENPGENPGGGSTGDSGNTKPTPKPDEKSDRKIKIDGGIVEVNGKEVKPDEDGNITVKEGDEITVTVDKSKISDAQVFDQWVIKPDSVLNEVDPKSEKISFTMPAEDVTIEAMTRDASIEDDGPGILGTGALIATGVVGSAALLYQGHMLGTELYLRYLLPHGAVIPQNRAELAVLLWQDAENPEPVSTTLYSDISEDDSAIQQAARWAVENDLMEQLDADDHPDHFDPFVPVTFSDSIRAWKKAQELKK